MTKKKKKKKKKKKNAETTGASLEKEGSIYKAEND